MASNSEAAFHWFENLCDEFSRNPEGATAELSKFRESEEAYSISQVVIQNSTKSYVSFHALAVLQHSYLTHYRQFSAEQNTELQNFLWTIIKEKGAANVLDQSVLTKLIHVFALVLKRNWMSESPEQRASVFTLISSFIVDDVSASPIRYKIAGKIISTLIEVFAKKKRTPDESIGYSPELQGTIHLCFQEDAAFCGLVACYQLSLQLLSKAFELSNTSLFTTATEGGGGGVQVCFNYQVASVVKTIYDLLSDLLGWEFDSPNSTSGGDGVSDEKFECGAVHIPAEWVTLAGGPGVFNDILAQLIQSYELIRIALFGSGIVDNEASGTGSSGGSPLKSSLCGHGCSFAGTGTATSSSSMLSVRIAGEYISSIRQLMLTFASFSSSNSSGNNTSNNGLFVSTSEKVTYSNQLLYQMITVLGYGVTSVVSRTFHSSGGSGGGGGGVMLSPEQVEDLLLSEIEHAVYILIRLCGNFHLSIIGQTATFESFMVDMLRVLYSMCQPFFILYLSLLDLFCCSWCVLQVELGRVTYELSTNMATVTERRVNKASGGAVVGGGADDDDDEFESENVLDGWRGDILSQLMDLWGMVLGNSCVCVCVVL